MRNDIAVPVLLACIGLASCGPGIGGELKAPPDEATPVVVADLRLGVDEGPEELMFGHINDLAIGANGEIYVADEQAIAIRAFDRSGRYRGRIGGQGQGPGEYSRIDSVKVLPNGTLVVLDRMNGRVSTFRPSGEFVSSFQPVSGSGGRDSLQIDAAGNVYVSGRDPSRPDWRATALFRYTNGREDDAVEVPDKEPVPDPGFVVQHPLGDLEPFSTATLSAWSSLGFLVVGRNDEYRIELRRRTGSVYLERDVDPVVLGAEEKKQWDALAGFVVARGEQLGFDVERVTIPDSKPFFSAVFAGGDGSIWVRRYTEAIQTLPAPHFGAPGRPPVTWVEVPTFDVFEPDGRFRGSVTFPMNTRPLVFDEDQVWGVHTDDQGVERVVRFRLSGWN